MRQKVLATEMHHEGKENVLKRRMSHASSRLLQLDQGCESSEGNREVHLVHMHTPAVLTGACSQINSMDIMPLLKRRMYQ